MLIYSAYLADRPGTRFTPVDRAWFQRLKLKHDVPLSDFAFTSNLQPYAMAALNADFEPTNDFEKEIMAKLKVWR